MAHLLERLAPPLVAMPLVFSTDKFGSILAPIWGSITYVWKAVSRDFHGACIRRPTIYAHSHSSSQLIWQDSGDWAARDSWPLPAKPKTDEHYIYIPFSVSPAARTIPFLKLHRKRKRCYVRYIWHVPHMIFNFGWHQVNLFELTRCRLGQNGSGSGMQYRASFRSVLDKSEVIRPKSTSTKWVGMSHLTCKPFKCSSFAPILQPSLCVCTCAHDFFPLLSQGFLEVILC